MSMICLPCCFWILFHPLFARNNFSSVMQVVLVQLGEGTSTIPTDPKWVLSANVRIWYQTERIRFYLWSMEYKSNYHYTLAASTLIILCVISKNNNFKERNFAKENNEPLNFLIILNFSTWNLQN
jgi:hypothetical protein